MKGFNVTDPYTKEAFNCRISEEVEEFTKKAVEKRKDETAAVVKKN